VLPPATALSDTLRLATYHTGLSRDGPGVLLRDIHRGEDAQITATLAVILAVEADILVLQDVDYDAGHLALRALTAALEVEGLSYPHILSLRPNTGLPTGHDLDDDGRNWRARDAHGFGYFSGQGGMAILSRFPFGEVRDFSAFRWANLPGSHAAEVTPVAALPELRLHPVAAWDAEVLTVSGPFHLLTIHASPPVFDGPEDRNGRRNEDELRFWRMYLDGWAPDGATFSAERFAMVGTLNVDPARGEGRRAGLLGVLTHPRVQDPAPERPEGGANTADWPEPVPGNLRVDYILPDAAMTVEGSGILWPSDAPQLGITAEQAATASDHRLVWVDLRF